MAKIWLVVLFCVSALLLVLLGAPKFLPEQLDLEVAINLRGSQLRVFELLENPSQWKEWNPFVRARDDSSYTTAGPNSGPGAELTWAHGERRESLRIAKTEPPAAVFYELADDDHALFAGVFHLVAEGDQTHVVWKHRGAFGDGYFQPVVLYVIRDRVEASMRQALEALRAHLDRGP